MKNYSAMQGYVDLRRSRPDVPALDVWRFVNGDYPEAANIDQAVCRHEWVVNEESDRCYCCLCLADGDA